MAVEREFVNYRKYVIKVEEGCWSWSGSTDKDGYGVTGKMRAHQVSWEVHHGSRKGLCVLHRCDNPRCTRPDHLWLGTHAENCHDRHQKGRDSKKPKPESAIVRGVRQRDAKLRDELIPAILHAYEMGETTWSIAARYGVSQATIFRTTSGLLWSHVPFTESPDAIRPVRTRRRRQVG